jgi:hypothetical protein
MKFALLLLFSTFCLNSFSQNCSGHTLFKKGVQLEYDYHTALMDGTTRKSMRLLFEVTEIEDRYGNTYSTILKKGYSMNSDQHFQRTIELACDGKNLFIPFDFYSPDTTYLKDVYANMKLAKKGYAFAYAPLKDDVTYNVPFNLEGISNLPIGLKKYVHYGMVRAMSEYGSVSKSEFEITITIKSVRSVGKESVKTPAGVFDCYKFSVEGDQQFGKLTTQIKYWLYFNNETGLVKYDGPGGFIELAGIKK